MRHHRAKYDLLAYAEALVDGGPVSVATARHVAACSVCRVEVEAIRASLCATGELPVIDAPTELTARILQAAAVERRVARQRRRHAVPFRLLRAAGYAAGLLMAASWCFTSALGPGNPVGASDARAVMAGRPAVDEVRQTADAVGKLALAVNVPQAAKVDPQERENRLDVLAREYDLRRGLAALERNPGCARVDQMLRASLNRQAKALKTLYVEQSL